ncbi:MAG: transporter substrate-binding domain-containing protein, partial [Burkholderiales bacterium]|nr:transporter substrate-binding domain-containing protein [Burkholderiales bacterium]
MQSLALSKILKRLLVPVLGALLAASAGSAAAADSYWQQVKDRGTIRVGVLVDWPPYAAADAQNQPSGYDGGVAKLLADHYGLKLEYVVMTGPNRIPFLLTDKADVLVASLAITPEREQVVNFSDPYYESEQALFVPPGSDITSVEDLAGKTVAAQDGTTGEAYANDETDAGQVRGFPTGAAAIASVVNGQADAGIVDAPPIGVRG